MKIASVMGLQSCSLQLPACREQWASFDFKLENLFKYEQRLVYIHQIAVHEEYRLQHVGRSIFNKIKSLTKEEVITHIELISWGLNRTPIHIFENSALNLTTLKCGVKQTWNLNEEANLI